MRLIREFEPHTYVSDSFRIKKPDALNKNAVPSPNDSRKALDEIVRALNDKQGITKTVDQCQRKPHYDAIDAVLGCRDVITCNKLRQVGITTPEPALDAEQTPEGSSTPSPATSSSTNSESSAETTRRKERKNRRKRTRAAESDSEEEDFRDVMKKLSGEGDALSRAIEGMQTAQAQQNQLMTQLLGSFNRYMEAKTSNCFKYILYVLLRKWIY